MHEASAHQVPDAFSIGHDPRDQDPGLSRIEIPNRKTRDVGHHLLAHLRDGSLCGDTEHLGQTESRPRLHEGGSKPDTGEQVQLVGPLVGDHVIDHIARHPGQHQPRKAAGQHHD